MSKRVHIPELRFKEFSGEWEKDILKNIFKISSDKFNPINNEQKYKCVELEHLAQNTGKLLGYLSSDNQVSIKNKFKKNDILFGKLRPYLKKYWLAQFDGVCSSEIWVLSGKKVINNFLFYLIQTDKFNLIANVSSGSKMPRADWKYMAEVLYFIPQKPEQQKIALFLTTIDTKIEQLTKKVELQEQYKKGVMQKIFNQEIRFKNDDGSEFPKWEEKRLGDVLVESKEKSTISGEYEILSSTKDDIVLQNEYFNREIASKDNSGYKILRKNQLVFSPQNLWLGNINVNTKFQVGLVSPSYKIFDFKMNIVLVEYCKYILKSSRMMYEYAQASEQGASVVRRSLNMDLFKSIKINLPSLEEQTKIANFLLTLDKQIDRTKEQLAKTKEFKKGLLQRMFI